MRSRLILSTAHALIGLSLIFIQVLHTSSVFETKTNFSRKNRLERQSFFRKEDAIYMYIYHTLAEAKDFRTGFAQILRNNHTEHLYTVNSIERYSILPEIVIAYLYKRFTQLTIYYNIPTVSCWERAASNEVNTLDTHRIDIDDSDDLFYRHNLYYYYDQHTNVVCDGPGLPIFFYLEVTWYLGGLTLFTLYLFATYLSRSVVAGLCAALYFLCIHNDATRIHSNPAARENFAIPFIISQMYFLSVWIEQHNRFYKAVDQQKDDASAPAQVERTEEDDRSNHFKLGFFTAFSIMAWDFSSYIFATQIVIILIMVKMRLIKRRHKFLQNFILAHIIARLVANNIVKYGWVEFHQKPMNFDCSALITLLLYIVQKYPSKQQRLRTIERIILRLFLLVMACTSILELFSDRNFYSQYMDVLLTKLYLKEATFSALFTMCQSDYKFIDFATLNVYNCLFVSKILIVLMLTCVVHWVKRQRAEHANANENDRIQRAKNYLLEDYLEENKLSMAELAKIEGNTKLQACMDLLKVCKYDYERYKKERKRIIEEENRERPLIERDAFLNEVRRFKIEISESIEVANVPNEIDEIDEFDEMPESHTPDENEHIAKDVGDVDDEQINVEANVESDLDIQVDWQKLFTIERSEYFYCLMQTVAFFILTILMVKIKYVLTPFLCLIASTFPPKALIPRNYGLWLIYTIVIGSCMIDRGIQNIKEQYDLKDGVKSIDTEPNSLHEMLNWIKSNTERSEVFAGPDDIIGIVLLTTGRPISNHALTNYPHMKKRLEAVYSMMSKQDSNSVYVQLSELKIDYVIVSHGDCFSQNDGCKVSSIWDAIQPEYQNNVQICADLFQRANLNFLKIFINDHYTIFKIFERFQIDLNLIQVLQEKNM